MMIVKVKEEDVEEHISKIRKCAEIIKKGGLVAFPTETVYGLGCDGLNEKAVKKLFKVKGRPAKNPLILHIHSVELAEKVAEVNKTAKKLMDEFFPGPLALVLKKKDVVPSITSAGMDKVAVRMPDNRIALKLIELSETAIAAPSANKSGGISPTNAEQVIKEFGDEIDAIIDGGKTKVGLESTVLDLTVNPPRVVRTGAVTLEMLESVGVKAVVEKFRTHKHYRTKAKVVIIDPNKIKSVVEELTKKGVRVGVCFVFWDESCCSCDLGLTQPILRKLGENLEDAARNVFDVVRELDSKVDVIIFEKLEEKGIGRTIMDRVKEMSDRQ